MRINQRGNRARFATFLLTAGALAAIGGCERPDAKLTVQITRASHAMSMTTGSGRAMSSEDQRATTYAKVISDLNAALDGASDTNKAVAQVLMARAKVGQASIKASHFAELLAELTHQVTLIRSQEARLRTQMAVTESLAGFDAEDTLAMVDARSAELDGELAQARKAFEELASLQAQVQARIDTEDAAARAAREQEQHMRDLALRSDGHTRLGFIEEAVDHQRAASQNEKRSAEIRLELESVRRAVGGRRREVATLERLRMVQDDTRDRIGSSQAGWSEQRGAALTDATTTATAISEAFAQAKAMLSDEVTPAYEETALAYQQAISQARSAQSALRKPAAMVTGSAQHALADVHAGMADALSALADVSKNMQGRYDVVVPLDVDALAADSVEANKAAKDALESAARSFGSAGGELAQLSDSLQPQEKDIDESAPDESEDNDSDEELGDFDEDSPEDEDAG